MGKNKRLYINLQPLYKTHKNLILVPIERYSVVSGMRIIYYKSFLNKVIKV